VKASYERAYNEPSFREAGKRSVLVCLSGIPNGIVLLIAITRMFFNETSMPSGTDGHLKTQTQKRFS